MMGWSALRRASPTRQQHIFVISTLTPIMLYLMAWALFPMIWAVLLSFFDYSATRSGSGLLGLGGDNPYIGLSNFREMLADTQPGRQFRISVRNTFIFAFAVLPINLAITLPLAALIEAVHDRIKAAFRAIYFLPTVTASVAVALMWGYIYNPSRGLLNMVLRALDLPPQAWLTDPRANVFGIPLAMFAIIIAYVWQDMGYNLVIFIAALQGIPDTFKDAARVDGANSWQVFRHITIPLLRPTLLFVCVMTMLSSFQVFDIFQLMTNGGPRDQTLVLVLNIYNYAFRFQRMGWASAMAMVLFVIIAAVTVIQMRLLRTEWEY